MIGCRTHIGTAALSRRDLIDALTTLEPRDRDVLRHLHVHGDTAQQAATALALPLDEVHHRAYRALRILCVRLRQAPQDLGSTAA